MRNEITAAVLFLVRLIERSEKFSQDQLECFRENLIELLTNRFKNHWFPDQPFKGQGYRCIRVNGHNRKDEVLESAANAAGVKYEDLSLPIELTLWVDPNEVCCRFGENRGSYCTLASFEDKPKSSDDESASTEDSDVFSEEQEASSEGEKSDTSSTITDKSSNSPPISERKNVALIKKLKASPKLYQNCRGRINQHQLPPIVPFRYAPDMSDRYAALPPPVRAQQLWFNSMQPSFICGPSPPPFLMHRGKRFNFHPRKIALKV